MDPIIRADHLTFLYQPEGEDQEPYTAIDNVSFSVERGSYVAILGRNGSGKSTLAKNINGLLLPAGGAVYVDGMDTADESLLWEIRRRCGMVFQNPDNQLVSSVVEDDVAFGPENLGVAPSEIRKRVDDALAAVHMGEAAKKAPHLLSGGQKQRIALAGVLALEPECVVLDEATAMLDPGGRREVMEIMEEMHKRGITVLNITHYMDETVKADRILVMDNGKLALEGTPAEIFRREEELMALGLALPFGAALAQRLRRRGIALPEDIIDEESLVEYICRSKQKN